MRTAAADHYDNQTSEERPKKKKPMTKYEKSEYISKSPETGKPYLYKEDGDPIVSGAKSKKSKGKAKNHGHEQAASAEQKPKKQFKKMSFSDSDKTNQTQAMPSGGAQAGSQTDASGGQTPSVHVMP
jgi:hypothetical protein